MLGHQLWRGLHSQHDTWVTLRRPVADFAVHNLFDEAKAIQFDDITEDTALERALDQAKPEAVINCVGLIKQRDEASDETLTLRCLLYTSPSPRDRSLSRMPSSA